MKSEVSLPSKLSPKGAKINNAAKETSGALMISIDCSHPDVEHFIDLKTDLDKVTKTNISVRLTKDFMEAVQKNFLMRA